MDQLAAKEANNDALAPANVLAPIQEMVRACIQCGTCTASCPNEFAMDHTPRKLWRLVLMGLTEQIFQSKTFVLCSNCYCCTLRCPRGLPLTEAMEALKGIAFTRQEQAPENVLGNPSFELGSQGWRLDTGAKTEATSIRGIQPGAWHWDASDGCGLVMTPHPW